MRSITSILLALYAAPALGAAPEPVFVASRQIALDFAADTTVTAALLYVSTDAGRNWQQAAISPEGRPPLRFDAPEDGRYEFFVVLRNATGDSAPPPAPGTPPTLSVVVDTVPPLMQVHTARVERGDDLDAGTTPTVILDVTLVDEYLTSGSVRMFFRTSPSEPWQDGGSPITNGRLLHWHPPTELDGMISARLMAVDRAGNRATADVPPLNLGPAGTTSKNTAQHEVFGDLDSPVSALELDPMDPVAAVAPLPLPPLTTMPRPALGTDELAQLRALGTQFMATGRFDLAAARFADAVARQPENPDLLVELGSALYRLGRFEEADARFVSALSQGTEHRGALRGRALVAATLRRYPDARELLARLQILEPADGTVWLHTGDVEHRLGNPVAAVAAWRRAAELATNDAALRSKIERRLEYFGTNGAPNTASGESDPASWPATLPTPRPSSSSSAPTSTASGKR